MDYVADTHSLVWYFTDDSHLGEKALKAFEQTGQITDVNSEKYDVFPSRLILKTRHYSLVTIFCTCWQQWLVYL
jgi:hypothetical protein